MIERNQSRLADFARDLFGDQVEVIVEVGARDGRETRGFGLLFPRARIVSFECNPQTLPQCREAVAVMDNAVLVEKAVSDRIGEITFYPIDTDNTEPGAASANPGASSLLRASGKYELETYVQRQISVPTTTLAAVMDELALARIDLLWMDIQGAELMALQGLGERLADVGVIHTEVEFVEIYEGQPLFADIASHLMRRGFAFAGFTIYSKHSADAVFVNRARFSAAKRVAALLCNRLLLTKRLIYWRHRVKRALLGRV